MKRNQEIVCSVKVKMCACLKGRIQELAGKGASPPHYLFCLKCFVWKQYGVWCWFCLFISGVSIIKRAQFTMNCSMCGSNSELTGFSTLSQSRKFLEEILPWCYHLKNIISLLWICTLVSLAFCKHIHLRQTSFRKE